jgi:hypothetical protein
MSTTENKTGQKTEQKTRSDAAVPTQRNHHLGLAAAGAVVVLGLGAGLTALMVGVSGNTDTEPPSPDVPPAVEMDVPAGVDQRLYEMADRYAEREAQRQTGPGPDQRLYELAERHAEQEAQQQTVPGPDQRLYELAP